MSKAQRNKVVKLIDAVGASTTSAPYGGGKAEKVFQVLITNTASVQLQASVDNINWVSLGAPITASGGYESKSPWPYMRADVTWTSGEVTVWVAD